jgi:alpha-tubulin suppressor-like RCC1 family protein
MYAMGGKSVGISSKEDAFQSLNFKGIDVSYIDTPTLITQFENEIVFEISAGSKHSVFATLADKVFACGSGLQGQLGLGAFEKQQAREHQEKPGDEPSPDENGEATEPAHVTDLRLL